MRSAAGRAATDTLSLSAAAREALAGGLDAVLLLRRLIGDEEAAVRALEAEVPLGLAEQLGGERLAAVRAVDREGIAGGGRCRHPQPRLACCRESPAQDRPRLGRGCGRPHRRQARDGTRDREPGAPLRGGAFRDRPRCRAPDALRRGRRRPAGRPRPSVRARQGRAPRRARRGDVPRRWSPC